MLSKRGKLVIVVLIVLAFALAVAGSGCRKKSSEAKLGLKPGTESAGASGGTNSQSGAAGSEEPKSTGATGTPTSGSGGAATGQNAGNSGSGSNSGSGTGSGSGGGGTGAKPPAQVAKKAIKILWWNDTVKKAPAGCEIVYGSGSFKPDSSKDAASGSIGPVPVGKPVQLVVYPDGRDGKKIVVKFTVDSSMIANSDRDAIHVEVSDARVRVLGNAVDGFDQTFDRF